MIMQLKTMLGIALFLTGALSQAQDVPTESRPVDVAVMFNAERANYTYANNFWMYGGSGEVAAHLRYGISLVVNAAGAKVSNANPAQSLSKIMTTAGPRYTLPLHVRRSRMFVEGLFGGVNGFNSVFPAPNGVLTHAESFAMQLGGGYDIRFRSSWSLRVVDAHYVRTDLPNGGTNRQNDLLLGAGIVWSPLDRK